mgnify:CR=1 FL=1
MCNRIFYLFKNYPLFYPQYIWHFSDPFSDVIELCSYITDQRVCIIHLWEKYSYKGKSGLNFSLTQNNPHLVLFFTQPCRQPNLWLISPMMTSYARA